MDTSVLLENKLRQDWSAPEFTAYLSAGRLEFACKEFATLDVAIKLRLLLSILSMSVKQLKALWNNIEQLLEIASNDDDEWVKVVWVLVKQRLPTVEDIGLEQTDTSGTDPGPNFFEEALKEIHKELGPSIEAKAGAEEVIWPEQVPFEWPSLCSHLRPEGVRIKDTNRHFVPIDSSDGHGSIGAPGVLAKVGNTTPAMPSPNSNSISGSPSATQSTPASSPGVGEVIPSNVPSSIAKILGDPSNDKLTQESRARIFGFYNQTTDRPQTGIELVLLNETRVYVDNNSAIEVTQVQLKLNHDDRSAKRVKNKKKYKLKV